MNSLFQQLQQPQMSNLQQSQLPQQKLPIQKNNLFQKFMSSSNPEQIIQNMIMKNPQLNNVMSLMRASNMTPKQFFYYYAQQNGVDPDQFINSMQQ